MSLGKNYFVCKCGGKLAISAICVLPAKYNIHCYNCGYDNTCTSYGEAIRTIKKFEYKTECQEEWIKG